MIPSWPAFACVCWGRWPISGNRDWTSSPFRQVIAVGILMRSSSPSIFQRKRLRLPVKCESGGSRSYSIFATTYSRERRSEEHTSELQSLLRISYAVFCLPQKNQKHVANTSQI